ncbi:MAG: ATP-binding protein, partial [Thermoanaerobaculia bacterium]
VRESPQRHLVAMAGVFIPDRISRMIDENIIAQQNFERLDAQRPALKASQSSLFLTVTLFLLFGALWTAMLVSRRITTPIQALAAGTRTLAEGDYGHRISIQGSDEFGLLIDSFNRMAEQLDTQRTALTESNAQLQSVNRSLDEERDYLSTVLDSVSTGILSLNDRHEVVSMNRAAVRILGIREPVIGMHLEKILTDELTSLLDYLRRLERLPRPREITFVRGGEIRYAEIAVAKMAGETDEAGWVVAIEETTELVRAQKLAAWSEAARRIAHEIKNPLTPIQLSAERIARRFKGGDPETARIVDEGCRTIVNEVGQLARMVEEFSRFARMPAIHLRQTSIAEILNQVSNLYAEVKPAVQVRTEVDPELRSLVDPEQIRRALINLLDNAIDATDRGEIVLTARHQAGRLLIEISDSGRGVSDSEKDKLFLPYFSTKERGTGLGLAIVHRIIADHDGRISVHDNHPQGTRFEIELPA